MPSLFNTDDVLGEIKFAFDTLHADGVILFTRYGTGPHYLGHEKFRAVWAELNRRKAVVFIHPTHPVDRQLINAWMPQPMFDYPHETGKTAMDLITSSVLRDHPDCKVILSHAGGTLPYLIHRAATMLPLMPNNLGLRREEIVEEARRFYFDTAISANPVTLKALFEFAKPGHVLFGSDFPNAPKDAIIHFTSFLNSYSVPEEYRGQVDSGAALELFPRLKARDNSNSSRI